LDSEKSCRDSGKLHDVLPQCRVVFVCTDLFGFNSLKINEKWSSGLLLAILCPTIYRIVRKTIFPYAPIDEEPKDQKTIFH